MRAFPVLSVPLALLCCPASAQSPAATAEPAKPATDTSVSIGDAVTTPVTDLNIGRDEIPALLVAAQERPYSLAGLSRCNQIAGAITALDGVLGDDLDLPQAEGERISAGRVAQAAVGSVIPFRGLIREISGANAHDRRLAAAVLAGSARRAFLKGYGQARGCRYPARAAVQAPLRAANPNQPPADVRYVSRPVVQKAD